MDDVINMTVIEPSTVTMSVENVGSSGVIQQQLNVVANGTYLPESGADAIAKVVVNVPNPSTGTLNITENGSYDVTEKATAVVEVPQPSGSVNITENGTHDVENYSEAVVNVPQPVDRFTKIATVELTANYGNVVVLSDAICAGFTAENNKLYYFKLQGGRASAIASQCYEIFHIGNLATITTLSVDGYNTVASRYKSNVAENRRFIPVNTTYINANNIGDKYDVYEVNLP